MAENEEIQREKLREQDLQKKLEEMKDKEVI